MLACVGHVIFPFRRSGRRQRGHRYLASMNVSIIEKPSELLVALRYSVDGFSAGSIRRMAIRLRDVILAMIHEPCDSLATLAR
jgi:hypothetical protein